MKRIALAALVAASIVGGSAGVASAGEITGKGTPTPIKQLQSPTRPAGPANSICAFSGRNDGYFDGSEPYRTQSWGTDGPSKAYTFVPPELGLNNGQVVKSFAQGGGLQQEGPGTACRGGSFEE